MRPTTSSTWASASSWVSFSFLTRLPIWPAVTLRASSMPASTSSWLMSLSTTSIPDAATVCAICPPMVPAPTTAALNTNIQSPISALVRRGRLSEPGLILRLHGEAAEGAAQRVAQGAADEEHVGDRPERPVLGQLVVELGGHPGPALGRLEARPLGAVEGVVVHLGGEASL